METIRRTPIKENIDYTPEATTQRQNRSAVQWLFNPFSVTDTTNWAVSTGVGKLVVGGLTKVKNHTVKVTPNKTRKVDESSNEVEFDSSANFGGYVESERLAFYIATEITGAFPHRVHRIKALEGIDDNEHVELIQSLLLGEEMAVGYIDGETDPVPNLKQMLEVLRNNIREIAKTNSPQKALLLAVGKEFEGTITDNIKLAIEDLKTPQQEVAKGKRAGFDVNAKRNFLALGKKVPELKFETQTENVDDSGNTKLAKSLDRLSTLLEGGQKPNEKPEETKTTEIPSDVAEELDVELPDGFLTDEEANTIIATTAPVETEMEFVETPSTAEAKPLTEKQLEKAETKLAAESTSAAPRVKTAETGTDKTITVAQCKALTGSGERCKKDALPGSEYCHIEAHQAQAKAK